MGASAAVVVGGGPVQGPTETYDLVITADSGLDVALAAGFVPTHLVGDLDSISPAARAWAAAHDVVVERHPTDKDATDTELALAAAVRLGATRLRLHGNTGVARLDHLLGTLAALGNPSLWTLESVTAQLDGSLLHVLHPGRTVTMQLEPGALFSLLALHGPCEEIDVSGARWPLRNARLHGSSTIGISNEALDREVEVSVGRGVLTVVIPPASTSPDPTAPDPTSPAPTSPDTNQEHP